MPKVKSFRIHPEHGVPDKDIAIWLASAEEEIGIIRVQATVIPAIPERGVDPRLNVIVTKLDDHG